MRLLRRTEPFERWPSAALWHIKTVALVDFVTRRDRFALPINASMRNELMLVLTDAGFLQRYHWHYGEKKTHRENTRRPRGLSPILSWAHTNRFLIPGAKCHWYISELIQREARYFVYASQNARNLRTSSAKCIATRILRSEVRANIFIASTLCVRDFNFPSISRFVDGYKWCGSFYRKRMTRVEILKHVARSSENSYRFNEDLNETRTNGRFQRFTCKFFRFDSISRQR